MARISVDIEDELYKELKKAVVDSDTTISDVVRQSIDSFIFKARKEKIKVLKPEIKGNEVTELLNDDKDVRLEFFEDGAVFVIPASAYGYDEAIRKITIFSDDYKDIEEKKSAQEWIQTAVCEPIYFEDRYGFQKMIAPTIAW